MLDIIGTWISSDSILAKLDQLAGTDMIFFTSSTSSGSVKYFWVWVKLYNMLTTLLEGKGVKLITQDEFNCKEYYTRW